jgi:DnaK suppressor protein
MDAGRARENLARERRRIEEALAALAPTSSDEPTTDQHLADQASELYEAEFDEGRSDDLRLELEAVERAESRLAAGTYGTSIESGAAIPDERLEILPAAERTAAEQELFDR